MRKLATLTYLYPGRVLACTLAVFAAAAFASSDVFDEVQPFDINDPDSEVVRASEAVQAATGMTAQPDVVLLVASGAIDGTVAPSDPARREARILRTVPGIAKVTTPAGNPVLTSLDGTSSLVLGYLEQGASRVDVGEAVDERFASEPAVTPGGTAVAAYQVGVKSERDTRRIELYASPILLLLLLLVFRTAIGAMLPLVVAALSILMTFATLRVITEVTPIDLFALTTVTGLGTGLAIDYSLFILARYREELLAARGFERAQIRTMRTAGRTVAFSSLTVAVALAAMIAFPQPFLHSTGIAGALTAVFAGLTAVLVLPSILSLLGPSVDRFAIRRRSRRSPLNESGGFWRALPRVVCRHPVTAFLAGAIAMLALASQALGIDLRTPDARELPSDESARVVADAIEDFPAVPTTALFAVLPGDAAEGFLLRSEIAAIPEVASVSTPKQLDADSTQLTITSSLDPLSEEGQDLVADVRDLLPEGALLGGRAAEQADQRSSIFDHAPLVIAIVVVTNLLILVAMTGSLLLPLLALAMNLLTVAAAIGTLVIAFTTEWGASLLGTDVQGGIDVSVPVITFAVGFGLATDYGIFLFARIRELREAGLSETDAIIEGVSATGRLISTSALLLAIAVGAFVFSDLVIIKEFAVAIAVAVLLDATVVRGLLIPALLRMLGPSAWWAPRRFAGEPRGAQVSAPARPRRP